MSSYTQLLSNYLANSNKPTNASKPDSNARSNHYLTTRSQKEETKHPYKESPQYLLPNYTSFPRANSSHDLFGKENSLIGSFEFKRTDNSRLSGLSEAMAAKPTYNIDMLMKQAKNVKEAPKLQSKKPNKDYFWDSSHESPSMEITKKKHEANMNRAVEDLLNYKPFETISSRSNDIGGKSQGYSNILRNIDQCVHDMKKYSARTTTVTGTQQDDTSARSRDMRKNEKEEFLYEKNVKRKASNNEDNLHSNLNLQSSPLSTIQFRSQDTEFINNTSDFIPKQQPEYSNKGPYKINHFLPQKRLLKTEAIHDRQLKKENFTQQSLTDEVSANEEPSMDNKKSYRVEESKMEDPSEIQQNSPSGYREEKGHDLENRNADFLSQQRENSDIYGLVKGALKKEKLLKGSEELVDSLSQTFEKLLKSLLDDQEYKLRKEKQNSMVIERLGSIKFLPDSKSPRDLKSCETQTEFQESSTPFFYKDFLSFPHPVSRQSEQSPMLVDINDKEGYTELENKGTRAELNRKPSQEAKDSITPRNKPASHMYALSFSVKKEEEKSTFPVTKEFNAKEFDIKDYLPKLEPTHESAQKKIEQREGSSPSFLQHESYLHNDKFSSRKSSLAGGSDNILKTKFNQSKGSFKSERTSANHHHHIAEQGNRSGRWNESSPNFFFEDKDGTIEAKLINKDRAWSPKNSSGFKKSTGLKEQDMQLGHRSATNLFASDLKNKAEKSFLNKLQNTQQSFTNFLKQKIEEVQEANHKQAPKPEVSRSLTPMRPISNIGIHHNSVTRPTKEAKPILPRSPSAIRDSKLTLKTFEKVDKSKDFIARRSSHQEPGSFKKTIDKPKWIEANFQEEGEIDRIVRSFV